MQQPRCVEHTQFGSASCCSTGQLLRGATAPQEGKTGAVCVNTVPSMLQLNALSPPALWLCVHTHRCACVEVPAYVHTHTRSHFCT